MKEQLSEYGWASEDLRWSLTRIFNKTVAKRGERLFNEGAVISLSIEQNRVIALVLGGSTYHVDIRFHNGKPAITDCDCLYQFECKHAAAVLYALLDEMPKDTQLALPIQKPDTKKKKSILRRSGEFTELPYQHGVSIEQAFSNLWLTGRRSMYDQVVKHELISAAEITSHIYTENYYGLHHQATIALRRQQKKIQIKCLQCDSTSPYLCKHQEVGLRDLMASDFGYDWLQPDKPYDFDAFVEKVASDRKMSQENFLKHFQILVQEGKFYSKTKGNGHLIDMPAEQLQDFIREGLQLPGLPSIEARLRTLEKNDQFSNAFVWLQPNYVSERKLTLIKGKMDKWKSKLSAHIKEVAQPQYLNRALTTFYLDLTRVLDQAAVAQDDNAVMSFLNANSSKLVDSLQYRLKEETVRAHSGDIRKKDLTQIYFTHHRASIQLRSFIEDDLLVIEAKPRLNDQVYAFEELTYIHSYFVTDQKDHAYLFDKPVVGNALRFFAENPKLLFYQSQLESHQSFLRDLSQHFHIDIDIPFISEQEISNAQKQIYLKESNQSLVFLPAMAKQDIKLMADQGSYMRQEQKKTIIYRLPEHAMADYLAELRSFHPRWEDEIDATSFVLSTKDFMQDLWYLNFYQKCKDHNIEVFGREELSKFRYSKHRAKVNSQIKSGIDWFDLDVSVAFGDEQLSTKDWLAAIRNNTRYVRLSDGTIGVLPEAWFKRFQKLEKAITLEEGEPKVSKLNFNIIDALFDSRALELEAAEDIANKKAKLAAYSEEKKYRVPPIVSAELRSYQLDGFKWMKFLQEFGFGGCLADDMGLGKTLQAICILADQKGKGTNLVVAPRTLLFNWSAELDKFCSKLKYLVHHGPSRSRDVAALEKFDVVISTYDTIALDLAFLNEFEFNYMILDESQAIKNPSSKRYRAMCLLRARYKLVMTGTPIENSTFDLYAQMNFVNPGFLGNQSSFKKQYVLPIEKHADEPTAQLLQKRIHPFVLRRTKRQVAKDLPEKTESILWCEMEATQRKQYESLKKQIREQVSNKIADVGAAKSKFIVLEGLLRLRQMCNAPELVDANLTKTEKASVKIDTLLEHLSGELGDHSALVFSQFVGMLNIIRRRLEEEKISYAYLDGSTRDRQRAVEQFNEEDQRRVFLISLKAGNTGLNLVKADYVYIVDPWWNPAVEAQAIDRTHRIGQDKHIFAYKMICKDTIEEKILKLQDKKKKLASDIIQTDTSVFKSLSKNELLALFD